MNISTLLNQADSLMICAGAGMGVDSGLPDFRGNAGMWQAYPALGKAQLDFRQIANPDAFAKNPRLAWGFYGHRLKLYRQTVPHQGFSRLLQLADALGVPYFVFTSNVDGQFTQAGFDPQRVYECHGSIHYLQCFQSCTAEIWSADALNPVIDEQDCLWLGDLPQCPHCGGLARPNILMFGDWHWLEHRQQLQEARLQQFVQHHQHTLVIEIGAGLAVPTVRRFSEQFCPYLIRINPRDSQIPHQQGISLAMTGLAGIEAVWQSITY